MADVVLIVPRINYDTNIKRVRRMGMFPPIGLLYMGAILKEKGIRVTLLDTNALYLSMEEIMERIKKEKPKIIGITAYSDFIRGTVQLAEAVREARIDSILTVGGPHISALSDFYEKFPLFDVALTGEGEITFMKMVKDILNGKTVKGLIAGELVNSLDELPFPDRDLLIETEQSYYSGGYTGFQMTNIHSSRGCPFDCTFCSGYSRKVRYHSPERVVNEIELCIKKYKSKIITFTDDCFTLKKDRVFEICSLLKKKRIKANWACTTRADTLNRELLCTMKEAGCLSINIGVETGNEEMRIKVIKKGIKDRDILNVTKWCDELGITYSCFFMFGFPGETIKELKETLEFARRIKTLFFSNTITRCYPATEIWETAVKENKYPADYWNRFARGQVDKMPLYYPDGFNRDEFLELTKRFTYKYYLNPRYIPIALGFAFKSYGNFKSIVIYFLELVKHLFKKFILKKKSILH